MLQTLSFYDSVHPFLSGKTCDRSCPWCWGALLSPCSPPTPPISTAEGFTEASDPLCHLLCSFSVWNAHEISIFNSNVLACPRLRAPAAKRRWSSHLCNCIKARRPHWSSENIMPPFADGELSDVWSNKVKELLAWNQKWFHLMEKKQKEKKRCEKARWGALMSNGLEDTKILREGGERAR